jgi:hypothetical protein
MMSSTMTPEKKIELEVKLMMLAHAWQVSDLDANGDLTYELDGNTYMIQPKVFPMGATVE